MHLRSDPKVVPLRKHAPPLDERSDDDLMQLASAGVDEAFAQLLRRHQRYVRAYCARLCGGAGSGDDVAQEVFVELWRRRTEYEPRGRFRSYLFAIAHSRCSNAMRARRPEQELPEQLPLPGTELDALLEAERMRRMEQKLALLSPKLQQALALRFAAGLEYSEMAVLLGRSQTTIRSRVFHGVLQLRKLLRKDAGR
jgi:RNA polymerase sigma-70 factor, ECF subfamily